MKSEKSKKLLIALSVMGGALAAFAIYSYVSYAQQFKTVFYKGTVINGIEAGFRTPEEVEAEIAEKAEDYRLTLSFREDASETIEGSDIDYHYVSDGSVQEIFEGQHYLLWPKGQFSVHENEVQVGTDFDHEKLTEQVMALPELQEDNMEAPKNAKVKFKKDQFIIKAEKYGTTLNPEIVSEAAAKTAETAGTSLMIDEVPDAYENPTVLEDDPLLAEQQKELNELACASITWQLPNGEETLNGNTLKKWLVKDDEGHYSKDEAKWEEKLAEYITDLAKDIKVVDGVFPFQATGIGDMRVYSDDYGWRMDYDAELEQTRQELAEGAITTREPNWVTRALYTENSGLGQNYVEVDLTRQHMWLHQNGQITMESDIVSGTMTYDRYTPSGIYFLRFKERDHVLRGPEDEDGNPEYETPCSYWMPFNGAIGFHDAWWRGSFGGSIYYYSGSHGCVNMPVDTAGQLFEAIDDTMPIVVYYSQGCELEPERNRILGLVSEEPAETAESADDTSYDDGSYDTSYEDGSYDDSSYDESYEDTSYEESYDEGSYEEDY